MTSDFSLYFPPDHIFQLHVRGNVRKRFAFPPIAFPREFQNCERPQLNYHVNFRNNHLFVIMMRQSGASSRVSFCPRCGDDIRRNLIGDTMLLRYALAALWVPFVYDHTDASTLFCHFRLTLCQVSDTQPLHNIDRKLGCKSIQQICPETAQTVLYHGL